ncbi:peripheral-type benzodiazepine receptor-associated protein 1-like isoform X4 [Artemia franciscana]
MARENVVTKPQKTLQNKGLQREKLRSEVIKSKQLLELEDVVRLVTLERQQLEKQLALAAEALQKQNIKKLNRQSSVESLRHRIGELDKQLANHQELASRLRLAETEVYTLSEKLNDKLGYCDELESQLTRVLSKNNELATKNNDLATKVEGLRKVDTELTSLRRLLSASNNGNFSDVGSLVGKVDKLESVLAAMRDAAEKRKEIEQQHAEAVRELQRRQTDTGTRGNSVTSEGLDSLQSQIRELEKKAELQTVRHEELLLEMAALRKPTEKQLSGPPSMLYTTANFCNLPGASTNQGRHGVPNLNNYTGLSSLGTSYSGTSGLGPSLPGSQGSLGFQMPTSGRWLDLESRTATPDSYRLTSNDSTASLNLDSLLDVDRLAGPRNSVSSSGEWPFQGSIRMRDLENERILAQLDKTRLAAGQSLKSVSFASKSSHVPLLESSHAARRLRDKKLRRTLSAGGDVPSVPIRVYSPEGTERIPSILSDPVPGMRQQVSQVTTAPSYSLPGSMANMGYMNLSDPFISQPSTNTTSLFNLPGFGVQNMNFPGQSLGGSSLQHFLPSLSTSGLMANGLNQFVGSSLNQPIVTSFERDKTPLLNGPLHGVPNMEKHSSGDGKVDMLDIPGKGRCYVYLARYSYDPFQQSPNERPEAELSVNAGDYILVWGNMDEDGFFDGELLDGRRGLVPSNFVQRLVGEDLLEFHRSVVLRLRDGDDSVTTTVPRDVQFPVEPLPPPVNTNHNTSNSAQYATDLALAQFNDFLGEEDTSSTGTGEPPESIFLSVLVPPPRQLTLERQLNKSILIGWNPPEVPSGTIEMYHVYVDGILKTTVKVTERTRALIDGVDSNRPHRISVRSVTPRRRASLDAACTMVIGKGAPVAPTGVKVNQISATSASIIWLPSNSNYQHTVCVNNVEVRTVKPGVYRHTISGLAPNTLYRVTIKTKAIRAPYFDENQQGTQQNVIEKYSTSVEFRTLSKVLPDPPVDVQVEPGPQNGTLLVTWLPVTIKSTSGTSNGVPVTGYAVYADGKKVTDVDSPTGDHALIDLSCLEGLGARHLTVRTKSRDGQSPDSNPTQIPQEILMKKKQNQELSSYYQESSKTPFTIPQIMVPLEALKDADKVIPAKIQEDKEECERVDLWLYQPHDFGSEPRSIDLSDIAEEDEDEGEEPKSLEQAPSNDLPVVMRKHDNPPTPLHNGIENQQDQPKLRAQYSFHEDEYMERENTNQIPSIEITEDSVSENRPYENFSRSRLPAVNLRGEPSNMRHLDNRRRGTGQPAPGPSRGHPQRRQMQRPPDTPSYGSRGRGRGNEQDPRLGRYGDTRARSEQTRIFVALYDYHPPSMSPNPDACEDELPFREGQLIKVFADKDSDGFYFGECNGRTGYVPCNMVSEVQVDDERIAQDLMKDHQESSEQRKGRRNGGRGAGQGSRGDRWGDIYQNMPMKKMVALYDYDPRELSPNVDADVELSFQAGDIIYVYGDMDDDGFFMGEIRGQRGLVPSNFLSEAPPDHERRRDHLTAQEQRSLPRTNMTEQRSRQREESRDRRVKAAGPEPRSLLQEEAPKGAERSRDGSNIRYNHEDSISETDDYIRQSSTTDGHKLSNGIAHSPQPEQPLPQIQDSKPSFLKGLPKVLPDIQLKTEALPTSQSSSVPVAGVNLMSKLSEMTQMNQAEGLLSKGKELIFKKFGL